MQDKFYNRIDTLIAESRLPRFIIIVSEPGSESDVVGVHIANKMECDYIKLPDVSVDTIRDMIKQAYTLHNKTVYIMNDADGMSVNAKNALLKVTEEIPNKAYFVMCLTDSNNTLATIRSRGTTFYMDRYLPEELADFARELYVNKSEIDEDEVRICADVCSTPGDVCTLMKYVPSKFYAYVKDVFDNIFTIEGAGVFYLLNKLAYKDEEDKYDCRLFLKAFTSIMLEKCEGYKEACEIYCGCSVIKATSNRLQDLRVKGINKQMLLETWALEVRRAWKSQS